MKRLIVCSDGTWNSRDRDRPTNVELIAQAIRATSTAGVEQLVFYDEGVGTNRGLERWVGGAFGVGLSKNVEDGYRFLVDNYTFGDEVYLFGFSRGAFTVRSIIGLIRKCGLLTKANSQRFREAYAIYRKRDDGADSPEAVAFRSAYSTEALVTCLGVWDTVGALGIPGHLGGTWLGRLINRDFEFHDVKISSKVVRAGYQALAVDEERATFAPAIWWREHLPSQALEQVWFVGCHSDVGGGTVTREEAEHGALSHVPLVWMIEQATRHGLEFDSSFVAALRPDPLAPLHESRVGFYRLLGRLVRPLLQLPGDPALTAEIEARRRAHPEADPIALPPALESPQRVDESVTARMRADPSYRPVNVLAIQGTI